MPLKRIRIGTRTDNRVYNFNDSWSPVEIRRVTEQLKTVFGYFGSWTDAALEIGDSLKGKQNPVQIPESLIRQAELLPTGWIHPTGLEDGLRIALPTINWVSAIHPEQQRNIEQFKQQELNKLQNAANNISRIENRPPTTAIPTTGTLQEALQKYDDYVKSDQPDNLDRHSKIKQLIDRSKDIPLSFLDIEQCRILIDYWRSRPERHDGKGKYSAKRSREQLAELDLFFRHTHTSTDFAWQMPPDLQLLKRTISKDDKKNLSFITIQLFTVAELKAITTTGSLIQKLITTWCLNCSHGAAEIGRVTWGDLYLNQDHPWKSQGLQIEAGGNWTGFLRHKTDVVGWWHLWKETVALIEQWRPEAERLLKRQVKDTDRLILTQSGEPMYKDASKNAQSKFAKEFNDVRSLAGVSQLPFGTLRNQLADWISTTHGDAVASSVALAHGVPHKADKLLYAHYSNRPWKQLFEYQMMFRELFFTQNNC